MEVETERLHSSWKFYLQLTVHFPRPPPSRFGCIPCLHGFLWYFQHWAITWLFKHLLKPHLEIQDIQAGWWENWIEIQVRMRDTRDSEVLERGRVLCRYFLQVIFCALIWSLTPNHTKWWNKQTDRQTRLWIELFLGTTLLQVKGKYLTCLPLGQLG